MDVRFGFENGFWFGALLRFRLRFLNRFSFFGFGFGFGSVSGPTSVRFLVQFQLGF